MEDSEKHIEFSLEDETIHNKQSKKVKYAKDATKYNAFEAIWNLVFTTREFWNQKMRQFVLENLKEGGLLELVDQNKGSKI